MCGGNTYSRTPFSTSALFTSPFLNLAVVTSFSIPCLLTRTFQQALKPKCAQRREECWTGIIVDTVEVVSFVFRPSTSFKTMSRNVYAQEGIHVSFLSYVNVTNDIMTIVAANHNLNDQ